MNGHQFKNLSYKSFDNQECATPTQSVRKQCILAFLGIINFTRDKNNNKPLDRGMGRVTIKILYSHHA